MCEIKRFDVYGGGVISSEAGMWVLYSDHEAAIRERDAEIERWRDRLDTQTRNALNLLDRAERAEAQRDELARRATLVLQYLDPVLSSGTFFATDEAIHIASLLSGGDGCGALDTTNKPL